MRDQIQALLGQPIMVRAYARAGMVAEFEGRLDSIDDPTCQVWAKNGNLFFHTDQVTQVEVYQGLPAYVEVEFARPIAQKPGKSPNQEI